MKPFKGLIIPILFTFGVLIPQSCVTQRRCLEKFPIKETHDTIITYRDTIIYVPVCGSVDTVQVYGTIRDTIYASSGTAHARTFVVRDTLRLNVWQADTVLQIKLDSAIRESQIKDTQIFTIKEKARFWDRFTGALWVILAIVMIIFATKLIK